MGTPIDLTERDPYTPIIEQLWAWLNADPAFVARVLPANQILYTKDKNPRKTGVLQPGACPEVEIIPGNVPENWAPQSENIETEPVFVITVLTGDMRLSFKDENSGLWQGANILRWIITRALCAAGDTLGISYVTEARVTTGMVLELESEKNRGHTGWALMITVKVRLTLDRVGDALAGQNEIINTPGVLYFPEITSADAVTGSQNDPFVYQIQATNEPTSFGATDLPDGLEIDTETGLITGSPTASGQSTFTVMATNSVGTGSLEVTLTVTAYWLDAVGEPWVVGSL